MSHILHFVEMQPQLLIYTLILILVFIENILPLMPGDGFLVVTAILAGRGVLWPLAAYSVTVIAAITGYFFLYYLGQTHGREYLEKKHPHLLPHHKIQRLDYYFHRYGYKVLAVGRFLPGTRFLIGTMAGFTRMKLFKAALYTSISIALWNLLIFTLGNYFTDNWHEVKLIIKQYNEIAALLCLLAVSIFLIRRYFTRKRTKNRIVNG